MKLTGELKDKVAATKSREQAKEVIEDAGMILDDEELDQVSGGISYIAKPKAQSQVMKGQQPKLSNTLYSGGKTKATRLGDLDVKDDKDDKNSSTPNFPQPPILC